MVFLFAVWSEVFLYDVFVRCVVEVVRYVFLFAVW